LPTILTHAAVPLALAAGLGAKRVPPRLLAAGVVASMLPDLDVIAFRFGIPYASNFGHRGFSHSIAFAVFMGLLVATAHRSMHATFFSTFGVIAIAMASHGLLDAFTNGGLGIALLWPWSGERHFAPVRPLQVSPISLQALLSERGAAVLRSEVLWVWIPAGVLALSLRLASHRLRRT
jgi:inner membrane protein